MCGIVGLYYRDPHRPVSQQTLGAMCHTIVHRGPDDQGYHMDGNVGMGMRRLSIIDLAGGHQPIFNEDGQVAVVFNGEIFNYPALKGELQALGHRFQTCSDTEVLVHGYEQWQTQLPTKLNGMFAFSIWDARRRRMLLGRDRIGVKPLYWYEDEEKLAWASEIKALLAVPGVRAELDHDALVDFITFGYVPAPRTLFRGIRKVPPATVVSIDSRGTQCETYWDVTFECEQRDERSWCEELRDMLDDAVRIRLMSDVPLGAFLSGGIDSSAIVATMHRLGVGKISTYAIGFGGRDAFHNELEKAAEVARLFETDHHEILVEPDVAQLMFPLVEHLDEPVTDTSFIVTYLVSRLARESVTVILSGLGGDEVFAGYRRYLGPMLQDLYSWTPAAVHRHLVAPLVGRLPVDRGSRVKSMFRHLRGFMEQIDQPAPARYQGYVGIFRNGQSEALLSPELASLRGDYQPGQVADYYRNAPTASPLNRMLYADMKTSLVDSLLTFTDKMSMAVSLEARVPLLDYRIVELAARIPPQLKLRGLRGLKYIFKQALADRLPPAVLQQRKMGFGTPISRWFRGSLRPLLDELLSPAQLSRRGYFNPQTVQQLLDDHQHQRADNSEHLLTLLTFEIWHQIYLDA
jgi:asparagine synthase (glutamine-hydrolysing)